MYLFIESTLLKRTKGTLDLEEQFCDFLLHSFVGSEQNNTTTVYVNENPQPVEDCVQNHSVSQSKKMKSQVYLGCVNFITGTHKVAVYIVCVYGPRLPTCTSNYIWTCVLGRISSQI